MRIAPGDSARSKKFFKKNSLTGLPALAYIDQYG
jgi:hypothetical protein